MTALKEENLSLKDKLSTAKTRCARPPDGPPNRPDCCCMPIPIAILSSFTLYEYICICIIGVCGSFTILSFSAHSLVLSNCV